MFDRDNPPVLTCVKRNGKKKSEVRFLVLPNVKAVKEVIEELIEGEVVLNTDAYTIYKGITEVEGAKDHRVVDHSKRHAKGDIHVNACENKHSFVRGGLRSSEVARSGTSKVISTSSGSPSMVERGLKRS